MTSTQDTPAGIDRRTLLRRSAGLGLGIAFTGSLQALAGVPSAAAATTRAAQGYGPLAADPAGLLALPHGFSYKVVARAGSTVLESGQPTPSDADGTASFPNADGFTLVNNHEISGSEPYRVPALPGLTYDAGAGGGTTSIDVDADGNRVREYVSVAGTHNNCAGGVTPWGTWLTCEETEQLKGGRYQQDHGYVFEVSPVQAENPGNSPVPLRFLGRFAHEAVAIDPASNVIYETEDAGTPNGLFFRWLPPSGFTGEKWELKSLAGDDRAGRLQALSAYRGSRHIPDLSQATQPGTRYSARWVDVPDRLAASTPVRKQFATDEVSRSRKLEGAWWADGGCYFTASFARASDGSVNEHDGQVWFYDPATETLTLEVLFRYTPGDQDDDVDGPDNIVVSPWGGVILAEDGEGLSHLVGVTDEGKSYFLARNDLNDSEFTGPNFSADNRILFANVQSPGLVYAITGPWGRPSDAR